MNTSKDPQFDRAGELLFQSRNEPLSPEDHSWLEDYLSSHQEVAAELRSLTTLADTYRSCGVAPKPLHRERMNKVLVDLVRGDVTKLPATRPRGLVSRALAFVLGDDPGSSVSLRTLLVGRALAVYLGVVAVICVYLATKPPERVIESHAPETVKSAPMQPPAKRGSLPGNAVPR